MNTCTILATTLQDSREIKELKKRLANLLERSLLPAIYYRIDARKKFCLKVRAERNNVSTDLTDLHELRKVSTRLIRLIDNEYRVPNERTIEEEFSSYFTSIESSLSFLPDWSVLEQKPERFRILGQDALVIKLVKAFKSLGINVHWGLQSVGRGLGLVKKPKAYWNHRVPVKQIAYFYFLGVWKRVMSEELDALEKTFTGVLSSLRKDTTLWLEAAITSDKPQEGKVEEPEVNSAYFDRLKSGVKEKLGTHLDTLFRYMEMAVDKAGTIEINASYFTASSRHEVLSQPGKDFKKMRSAWNRNHGVIRDDWKLSNQLVRFYAKTAKNFKSSGNGLSALIHEDVASQVEGIKSFILGSKERIQLDDHSKEEWLKSLEQERTQITTSLRNDLVPKTITKILSGNLPAAMVSTNSELVEYLEDITNQVKVVQKFEATKPVGVQELNVFNPRTVVSEVCVPLLGNHIAKIEEELLQVTGKFEARLIEIVNVHAYSIESAVSSLQEQTVNLREVAVHLEEGISRSESRLNELWQAYLDLEELVGTEIDKALAKLGKELINLSEAQNALEVNFKLLRIKTKTQTTGYFEKAWFGTKAMFKLFLRKLRKLWRQLLGIYVQTEEALVQTNTEVRREDLNLLSNTRKIYKQLPFIYRMLYNPDPLLNDFTFYVKRDGEYQKLVKSFDAWMEGNSASVLVSGSAGSGSTTLLNYFIHENLGEMQLNRIDVRETVSSLKQLVDILKVAFNYSKVETLEELAEKVNTCGFKRICLVEQLQNYFLREVGGFEVLGWLRDFMDLTKENVFWLCTITDMSLSYLDKTTSLSDYFTKKVVLDGFTLQQLRDFLLTRHRVSGYDIEFYWPVKTSSKKVLKKNGKERHSYLMGEFVGLIHRQSEGNLHFALLHWILSIKEVNGNTMVISPFNMEMEMVKGLADEKLAVLHTLVLHDGLSQEGVMRTTGFSEKRCSRILSRLVKDGLVLRKENLFEVNLLLTNGLKKIFKAKNMVA